MNIPDVSVQELLETHAKATERRLKENKKQLAKYYRHHEQRKEYAKLYARKRRAALKAAEAPEEASSLSPA